MLWFYQFRIYIFNVSFQEHGTRIINIIVTWHSQSRNRFSLVTGPDWLRVSSSVGRLTTRVRNHKLLLREVSYVSSSSSRDYYVIFAHLILENFENVNSRSFCFLTRKNVMWLEYYHKQNYTVGTCSNSSTSSRNFHDYCPTQRLA